MKKMMTGTLRDMQVNFLPSPTWKQLHMNSAAVKQVQITAEALAQIEAPDKTVFKITGTGTESWKKVYAGIEGGMGKDMEQMVQDMDIPARTFRADSGDRYGEAVRIGFEFGPQERSLGVVGIHAEKDSEITVIMDYRMKEERHEGQEEHSEKRGIAAVQTKIRAEKGAHVRLVQIQRLGGSMDCLNDIGIICGDGARAEVIHLVLGGAHTYQGCRTELNGKESALETDTGYYLDGHSRLDMNYHVVHEGRKTKSRLDVSGVLKEHACKLFRGTIDFRTGAGESVGEEKEDVLLLDDTVVNQTIPLILCAEEDVQGSHGATIGRLSDEILFYMRSRGLESAQVYEMMARARIDRIWKKIPDKRTRGIKWAEGWTRQK